MSIAFPNKSTNKITAIKSEVIRKLSERLGKDEINALQDFWKEIEDQEIPLINEIESDAENIIYTFIFEGNQHTKSVFVNLPPFSRISPKEFQMTQVEKTDVWFTSVKLPIESRFAYSFVVNFPFDIENPKAEIQAFLESSQADPLNPNLLGENRSFIETPKTISDEYYKKREGIEEGSIEQFTIKSEILNNKRSVSVYTPPSFDKSKSYPILVLFDEEIYLDEINAPTILDNLLAENLIPPMIMVLVGNAQNTRSLELAGNTKFCDFVNVELLDWTKSNYKITENPQERIIGGSSFGGLCAVYLGIDNSSSFGKILSQSGSFWNNSEIIFAKLSSSTAKKQKFYLDAGIYEIEERNSISLLEANRKLHNVLLENEYVVEYQEFKGGHGAVNWRETFADGLMYLTKELLREEKLVGNPNLF